MAAKEDINTANAIMSPGMAAALQTGFSTAMQARDDLMNLDRGSPNQQLMVKLTAQTSGAIAWTEQYRDTTGARVDKPSGRTGTATSNPAYDPNGLVPSFPFACWIREAGWVKALDGAIYEVVGGVNAGWVQFTLSGALATTDASKASCTVDAFWGGGDPGATVTVYNMPASTNYAFSGASGNKGYAVWDDVLARYRIIQLQCP